MSPLLIDSRSFLPRLLAPKRVFTDHRSPAGRPHHAPRNVPTAGSRFSLADDSASSALSIGLIAVTLPTVAYAFYQLWHLVGGETLNQAVRAFAS